MTLRFPIVSGMVLAMLLLIHHAAASGGACSSPADCSNQGVCVDGTCECNAGRSGADCSIEVNCPDDCGANGVCALGQCYCNSGFSGVACNRESESGGNIGTSTAVGLSLAGASIAACRRRVRWPPLVFSTA